VRWMINGKELNECNRGIIVPQYGIKVMLHPSLQTVEFTPKEAGIVPWSCWMGMIPGSFIVIDNNPEPISPAWGDTVSNILQSMRHKLSLWAEPWLRRLESP